MPTLKLLSDCKKDYDLNINIYNKMQESYENARDLAMGETELPEQTFPLSCPYRLTEILDDRFYPGEPSELVDNSDFI